jgi:RNA polymerase sigma-70 factor (ECF subfamily)
MTTTAAEQLTTSQDEVWATMARRLRAFVARRVPDSDADDITQDILLRILRSGRTADDAAATPAWLFTVARNAVIDHYRTRKSHDPLPPGLEQLPDADADNEPSPALQEAARCLRPVVATLDDAYRDAVTMVDLDGMTHTAAACAAGLSVPGMKSRVQRGRRQLADKLRTWCSVYLDETGQIATDPCACGCGPVAC